MTTRLRAVLEATPRLLARPQHAIPLIFRRLLPIGVILQDREAYNLVGSWTFGRLRRLQLPELFPGIEATCIALLRAYDRDAESSATIAETVALAAITQFHQPKRILEIGTFNGNTTLNFAANSAPDCRITTVDLPVDWNGTLALDVPLRFVNVTDRPTVGSQAQASALSAKIRQVHGDSATLDWDQLGGPFDLIFIDGCHHYNYVRSDTLNAVKRLTKTGIVIWHDYGMIPDVSRVVDEMATKLRIVAIAGARLAVGWSPSNGVFDT